MTFLKTTAMTAALALAANAAFAESHVAATDDDMTTMEDDTMAMDDAEMGMDTANLIRTTDITGGNIYTMNPDEWAVDDETYTDDMTYNAVGDNWENIGEIGDIVLSREGEMIGIVGDIGGFLGLGETNVLIPVSDVRLTAVDDASYAYVTQYSQEQLESLEEVDDSWWD